MASTKATRETFAKMSFAKIHPMYLSKVAKKGRTADELQQVVTWLTGLDAAQTERFIEQDATFEELFDAATLHPNATQITGVICGTRVEDIKDDLTQKVRYLDKLVDELAKGKKMEKILRGS